MIIHVLPKMYSMASYWFHEKVVVFLLLNFFRERKRKTSICLSTHLYSLVDLACALIGTKL